MVTITELIHARIVFDTPKLPTGELGKAAGGTQKIDFGGATAMGAAKNIGKMALGVTGGLAIFAVIQKALTKLVAASPQLAATLKIFGASLNLMLRPVGDLISMILRPFALAMLRFAIPFYRWASEWLPKLLGGSKGANLATPLGSLAMIAEALKPDEEKPTPDEESWLDKIKEVWNKFIIWAGESWAWVKDKFLYYWGRVVEEVGEWFEEAIEWVADWFQEIEQWIHSAGDWFHELLTDFYEDFNHILEPLKKFFDETVSGFLKSIGEKIGKILFDTIPKLIIKGWEILKDFFTKTIPEWISSGFNSIKDFFLKKIPDMIINAFNRIKDAISNLLSIFTGSEGGKGKPAKRQYGGFINPGQTYLVGETGPELVTPSKPGYVNPTGSFGGRTTINLSINALDASSISRGVLDKITRSIEDGLRRGFANRTTESHGI